MKIFRHPSSLPATARGTAVAIGNFDGIHRGHQFVIASARERAERLGLQSGVVTFEPHPRSLFVPTTPPYRLTPFRVKARCISQLGIDVLFCLPFNRALAAQSADEFFSETLVRGLGVAQIVVGWDFVFGKDRRGNVAAMEALAVKYGIGTTILDPVTSDPNAVDAEPVISATRVRAALATGEVRLATQLLGRHWELEGHVKQGDRRGRTIGFPTANIGIGAYLRPRAGVYAVQVGIEHEGRVQWCGGVANIGDRPTVAGQEFRLEAHLFDFAGDLYGKRLRVGLVEFLRPEQRFPGIDALKMQIAADADAARRILATGQSALPR